MAEVDRVGFTPNYRSEDDLRDFAASNAGQHVAQQVADRKDFTLVAKTENPAKKKHKKTKVKIGDDKGRVEKNYGLAFRAEVGGGTGKFGGLLAFAGGLGFQWRTEGRGWNDISLIYRGDYTSDDPIYGVSSFGLGWSTVYNNGFATKFGVAGLGGGDTRLSSCPGRQQFDLALISGMLGFAAAGCDRNSATCLTIGAQAEVGTMSYYALMLTLNFGARVFFD